MSTAFDAIYKKEQSVAGHRPMWAIFKRRKRGSTKRGRDRQGSGSSDGEVFINAATLESGSLVYEKRLGSRKAEGSH
jgi:hypothetical protein